MNSGLPLRRTRTEIAGEFQSIGRFSKISQSKRSFSGSRCAFKSLSLNLPFVIDAINGAPIREEWNHDLGSLLHRTGAVNEGGQDTAGARARKAKATLPTVFFVR